MLNIAICDDDSAEIQTIVEIAHEYKTLHIDEYDVKYKAFFSGDDLLQALERGEVYNIFLLDVIMPFINGIDVAKELRLRDNEAKIIFLTSSPEFAVASYSVDAFYYLLKPVTKEKLYVVLEKAAAEIISMAGKSILIKSHKDLYKIYLHNIEYVEVNGRRLVFHLRNGNTLESTGALSEIEKVLLGHRQFIKPHRSYIINMDHIDTLTINQVKTSSHMPIPISRVNYPDIKKAYIEYSFGKSE
jgi:DNA-binding LytR/AlgR family response regulator